jgi:hypothetical protein
MAKICGCGGVGRGRSCSRLRGIGEFNPEHAIRRRLARRVLGDIQWYEREQPVRRRFVLSPDGLFVRYRDCVVQRCPFLQRHGLVRLVGLVRREFVRRE